MSTFSTDAGLELMGTGEFENTWGDKANNNLLLLEKIYSKFTTLNVTGSGDFDLTTSNGYDVSATASYAVLRTTGVITAARTIVIPSNISGTYILFNSNVAPGAFAFQIKVDGGALTIDMPAIGESKQIWMDGSEVYSSSSEIENTAIALAARVTVNEANIAANTAAISALDSRVTNLEGVESFPVGFIVHLYNTADPATVFGYGTWTNLGQGKVLVGLDSGDIDYSTIGNTGGAKEHTITVPEMPSHNHPGSQTDNLDHSHSISQMQSVASVLDSGTPFDIWHDDPGFSHNTASGGGGVHDVTVTAQGANVAMDIRDPYVVVNIWRRTV